jgi:hypothetical protein
MRPEVDTRPILIDIHSHRHTSLTKSCAGILAHNEELHMFRHVDTQGNLVEGPAQKAREWSRDMVSQRVTTSLQVITDSKLVHAHVDDKSDQKVVFIREFSKTLKTLKIERRFPAENQNSCPSRVMSYVCICCDRRRRVNAMMIVINIIRSL